MCPRDKLRFQQVDEQVHAARLAKYLPGHSPVAAMRPARSSSIRCLRAGTSSIRSTGSSREMLSVPMDMYPVCGC